MHRVAVVLVVLALVAACSSGDDDDDDAATSATTTTAELVEVHEPSFAARPCEDPVPDDPRIDCGDLTVPADRAEPDGGDVVLPVAIIRSASSSPAPDPIVFVSGGPGDFAMVMASLFLQADYGGERDLILFEQRGNGGARPSLDCPELDVSLVEQLATADPPAVEAQRDEQGRAACRDRLVDAGVDLDDISTSTTADDLDDLRIALGLEQWNVWGLSYGTLVGQELLRRHPDGVRSAVLDGVVPVDVGFGNNVDAGLARDALHHLFEACAEDPACSSAYPALEADFRRLFEEWNADPFRVVAATPDGDEREFLITGHDVVSGAFQALYDTSLVPVLPSLVPLLLERGDGATAIVRPLVERFLAAPLEAAEGTNRAVNCNDAVRVDEPLDPSIGEDEPLVAGFVTVSNGDQCEGWGDPGSADFAELVESDIPTLLLVGDFDPVTPPAHAHHVATGLSDSRVIEIPGAGHATIFAVQCAADLMHAFFPNPLVDELDTSCVDDLGPPEWAV